MSVDYTFVWTMIAFFAIRVWLLFFDHRYAAILAVKPWQIVISPRTVEQNWYIRRKHTFGKGTFILKWMVAPLIALRIALLLSLTMTGVVDEEMMHWLEVAVIVVICIVTIIFIGCLWSRYPEHEDAFFIRHELKVLSFYAIIAHCFVIPTNLATLRCHSICVGLPMWWVHPTQQMMLSGFLFIMVVYPQRKSLHQARELSEYLTMSQETTSAPSKPSMSPRSAAAHHRQLWQDEISTQRGYECFANYLVQHFALENLLFVTEFSQLKTVLLEHESIRQRVGKIDDLEFRLVLPAELPLSAIAEEFEDNAKAVTSEDGEDTEGILTICFDSMTALFVKYIEKEKAPLEININSTTRDALQSVFAGSGDDQDIARMLHLVEDAALEIVQLMTDTAIRYFLEKNDPAI